MTAQYCSNCGAALAGALSSGYQVTAAAMTTTTPVIAPSQVAASPIRYGGFWIRFVAAVIDGIIVQAVVMPVALVLGLAAGIAGSAVNTAGQGLHLTSIFIAAAFGLFSSWLYEAMMESSSRQATLGKMIFGMKVTDLHGNRISFAQATARHFSKYLSAMIMMLGYIMAGFTAQKRALHDMIAGTVVRR